MRVIDLRLGDKGKIESVDWVAWIMNEIEGKGKGFTRTDIAKTYAILIQSGHKDWIAINEAIIKRWGKSSWQWIKTRAWKQLEREQKHNQHLPTFEIFPDDNP